ncbi:MAG: winged helix-turn-helix domain-containing protein [Nitrososphaerales archaeon]
MSQLIGLEANILGANRGSLEIINTMLNVSMNGMIKTQIMYRCNLNSKQLQGYLNLLLKWGMLERKKSLITRRSIYTSTERGRKFVSTYAELSALFDNMNIQEVIDDPDDGSSISFVSEKMES